MQFKSVKAQLIDCMQLVYSVAFKVLRDRTEAEDTAQDSYLLVLKHLEEGAEIRYIKTYIAKVAYNKAIEKKRSDKIRRESLSKVATMKKKDGNMEDDITLDTLKAGILELSGEEQLLLTLAYTHEMKHHEIAEVVGMPKGSVSRKIFEARDKLRDKLSLAGIIAFDTNLFKSADLEHISNMSSNAVSTITQAIDTAVITTSVVPALLTQIAAKYSFVAVAASIIILTLLMYKTDYTSTPNDTLYSHRSGRSENISENVGNRADSSTALPADNSNLSNSETTTSLTAPKKETWRSVELSVSVITENGLPLKNVEAKILFKIVRADAEIKQIEYKSFDQVKTVSHQADLALMVGNVFVGDNMLQVEEGDNLNEKFFYKTTEEARDKIIVGLDNQLTGCFCKNLEFELFDKPNVIQAKFQRLSTSKVDITVIDLSGNPLPETYITVPPQFRMSNYSQVSSDLKGKISIQIPSDGIELTFSHSGYIIKNIILPPQPPNTAETITVTLEKGTESMRGTCLDENNKPVSGATIYLHQEGIGPITTRSGPEGDFVIEGLLPGKIICVNVSHADYEKTHTDSPAKDNFIIVLKGLKTILTGRCVSRNPIDNSTIGAGGIIISVIFRDKSVIKSKTDKDGNFAVKTNITTDIEEVSFTDIFGVNKYKTIKNPNIGETITVEIDTGNNLKKLFDGLKK
ncbi:MAG: sigma-70 family RNA polymerase sigma factor [Planctomycetes bacterium]|nr:sigma-70 family RNA polymerase sigma factor [Planctomycetota bacterium]